MAWGALPIDIAAVHASDQLPVILMKPCSILHTPLESEVKGLRAPSFVWVDVALSKEDITHTLLSCVPQAWFGVDVAKEDITHTALK